MAEFYFELMSALHSLGIDAKVWTMPVEVPRPVRFNLDEAHSSYDSEYAHRFWQILVSVRHRTSPVSLTIHWKGEPGAFFLGQF